MSKNNQTLREKFIRLLKDNHAFQEYLQEIKPWTMKNIEIQLSDGGEEFLLQDGCIFFYREATTFVNWDELNLKWVEMLEEERAL